MNIKKVIDDRELKYLVHFTTTLNLDSILKHGLYSHLDSENDVIDAYINDSDRLEGLKNGICLSLTFPNSKMFYSCRQRNDYPAWCVLVLDISILLEKSCLFFDTNAAFSKFRGSDLNMLTTAQALDSLFANEIENKDGVLPRSHSLLSSDPTDVQAEVICMEHIESVYIKGIIFDKNNLKDEYQTKYPDKKFVSHQGKWGVFDDRSYARNNGYKGVG